MQPRFNTTLKCKATEDIDATENMMRVPVHSTVKNMSVSVNKKENEMLHGYKSELETIFPTF